MYAMWKEIAIFERGNISSSSRQQKIGPLISSKNAGFYVNRLISCLINGS